MVANWHFVLHFEFIYTQWLLQQQSPNHFTHTHTHPKPGPYVHITVTGGLVKPAGRATHAGECVSEKHKNIESWCWLGYLLNSQHSLCLLATLCCYNKLRDSLLSNSRMSGWRTDGMRQTIVKEFPGHNKNINQFFFRRRLCWRFHYPWIRWWIILLWGFGTAVWSQLGALETLSECSAGGRVWWWWVLVRWATRNKEQRKPSLWKGRGMIMRWNLREGRLDSLWFITEV